MLKAIYGHHNLTSDTEPEEVLIVSKKRVMTELCRAVNLQNDNEEDWIRAGEEIEFTLTQLFGDKCLPDKDSDTDVPKPKFPIGSIVRITNKKNPYHGHKGKFGKVITYNAKFNRYAIEGIPSEWEEGDLEPYTEEYCNLSQNIANCDKPKDNQLKDNMEEKELNLSEILTGCQGEEFYSLSLGTVKFEEIKEDYSLLFINVAADEPMYVTTEGYGAFAEGDVCLIYPSRALYERYPLDAYSAWMEWKEARKPKIWRAERGSKYWWFNDEFEIRCNADIRDSIDNNRADFGNYFRTEEEAKQAAGIVKDALQKFHEQHEKN